MKNIISAIAVILLVNGAFAQNVGIGTNAPATSAKLDITSTNSGLLVPRIPLISTTDVATIPAPATSVLVYNTNAGMTNGSGVGYYYWTGTAWIRLLAGTTQAWNLTGNSGTAPATNFIGTIDAVDFVTRTNNIERMRILSGGNVGIGTATPAYRLDLASGTFGFGNSNQRTETRADAGLQGNAGAQSGFYETSAPVNYPTGATSWWHLIDSRHSNTINNYALQIAGSFFDQNLWFRKTNNNAATPWSQILSSNSGWTTTGNAGTNAGTNFVGTNDAVDFVTRTNNSERMRVTSGGNVGIGTAAPTTRFHALNADNSAMIFGTTGNISSIDPEAFVGEVRLGAAWNRPGVYSSSQLELQNNGVGIFFGTANIEHMRLTNGGNLGIGTNAPAQRLSVSGTIQAIDVYAAGGQNIQIGDDAYLSDMDIAHRMGIISSSNAGIGEIILGNTATNPVLTGMAGNLSINQEVRIQAANNRVRRSQTPQVFTDVFDNFPFGVHLSNNESEEGGFWANGNYAMVYSPGDNDLVKFVDEDGWDNAGTAFDGTALRARIDGGGQYFQVSDANAKNNIVQLNSGLSKVILLSGYSYNYNLLPGEIEKNAPMLKGVGVLAQEVEKVFPQAVSNVDGQYMVNYSAFVPLFIEAFKDQQVIIEEQNQKIDNYEKELESNRLKQEELAKEMSEIKRLLQERK